MVHKRQIVDYALVRKAHLADFAAGRASKAQTCDADRYLLRAAHFHGISSGQPCPVCEKSEIAFVNWVFGETLDHADGSARTLAQIEELAGQKGEFTVHVVEVCKVCKWNHLVESYLTGQENAPRSRRGRSGSNAKAH